VKGTIAIWTCLLLLESTPTVASTSCRYDLEIGHSIYLGAYDAGGARCVGPSIGIAGSLRYTEQQAGVHPTGFLTTQIPLSPEWALIPTFSVYELSGDYEIDRLPEAVLAWTPSANAPVIPTVNLTAGLYTDHIVPISTTRVGGTVTLSVPSIMTDLGAWSLSVAGGMYGYGTGQSLTFWSGLAAWTTHLGPGAYTTFTYQRQDGWGVTPLQFDNVYLDQLLTGTVSAQINKTDLITFSATLNLQVSPGTLRSITIAWLGGGGPSFNLLWQQEDGHLSFSTTFPM
jgi:hypothetical protein